MFQLSIDHSKRSCVQKAVLAALLLVSYTVLSSLASAQTSDIKGSIQGRVLDASGGAVTSAEVVAKSEPNGPSLKTTTDGTGHFSLAGVSEGTYTVEYRPRVLLRHERRE